MNELYEASDCKKRIRINVVRVVSMTVVYLTLGRVGVGQGHDFRRARQGVRLEI